MVNGKSNPGDLAALVREWLALRSDFCRFEESESEFELCWKVRPLAPDACPFELRIGKRDGGFDVSLGRGLSLQDLPASPQDLKSILDAIESGQILETVVETRGRLVESRGEVRSGSRVWHSRRSDLHGWLLRLFRGADQREVNYQPWRRSC